MTKNTNCIETMTEVLKVSSLHNRFYISYGILQYNSTLKLWNVSELYKKCNINVIKKASDLMGNEQRT